MPLFFLQKYATHKITYSWVNALALGIFGLLSNLLYGMIGDRFEGVNPRIKARVCQFSCLLTIPIMALELGNHGNYWIS